jgi:hypothetical protein
MERDKRFWEALREEVAERRGSGEAPSPDEVLAFVEGRLDGAEREQVADAIAASPATARLARDLARFPDVEPDRVPGRVSAEDAADLWRRIEAGLERAPAADEPAAPVAEGPAPLRRVLRRLPTIAPRRAGLPRWTAVAAALVGAVVGVAGLRLADRDLPQPNPEVLTLMPRGEGLTRSGAAEQRSVAGEFDRLVLILEFGGAIEPGPYRLVLRDQEGRALWTTRDLRRGADGSFTLSLPAGFLGAGAHMLELHGTRDPESPPLAIYDLDPGRPATR